MIDKKDSLENVTDLICDIHINIEKLNSTIKRVDKQNSIKTLTDSQSSLLITIEDMVRSFKFEMIKTLASYK